MGRRRDGRVARAPASAGDPLSGGAVKRSANDGDLAQTDRFPRQPRAGWVISIDCRLPRSTARELGRSESVLGLVSASGCRAAVPESGPRLVTASA
jgi:hypothetical protein